MALETSPERPAPVRQIATLLTGWIDRLGAVWVEGQITQINRRQGMGTVFLALRDPLGDISMTVTCQRQVIDAADPPVVEGASVVVHGRPRYYTNRGTLSLVVDDIRMVGLGELLARLERRRQLLAAEGLFARERKRALPFLPHRVGLVTARGSAAERDVLENARRRWPAVAFETRYAAMQGPACAREVMEAVQRLDAAAGVDVIVVARGGGSIEDLLPFSDEGLVRVVAQARTPVVSAIGHEQDTPLLDLVADVRASTPTDAAKLLVPDVAEEQERVSELRRRARRHVRTFVAHELAQLAQLRARPVLSAPVTLLQQRATEVEDLRSRGRRSLVHRLDRAADDLDHARARVRALSPRETLRRGYAVVQDADGHVLTSTEQTAVGQHVTARLFSGHVALTVDGLRPEHADPDDHDVPDDADAPDSEDTP